MTFTKPTALLPKIIRPEEGDAHVVGLDHVSFLLTTRDTEGAFTLGFATIPPGGGPPPHVHHREDEVFVVTSGELDTWTPAGWRVARAGDVVFLPADVPHTYTNRTTEPATFYVFATPAGFESFYAELAGEFAGTPDARRVADIAERHGIEFLPSEA